MFFYTFMPKLFNMSLTASVAIVLVILLRLLLKKAPKVISYALWGVVLFRLLCPVSIGSNFSVYNLFDAPAQESGTIISVIEYVPSNIVHTEYPSVALPVPVISDVINDVLPQGQEQLVADPLEAPMSFATYAWMIGVLVMVIYSIVSYIRLRRKLSVVVPLRDNIFIADDIKSPFVVGLFRPKIYLPCNLGDKEQEYIILHEQHHIKRLDHVMKALAFLALAIHWFNPLVWVAFILASKDMEMSCDEAVIRKIGGDVRADYSASLLTLATGRRIIAGTPLAFGEGDTKGRINNLSKWKKPAVWVVLLAVIACIVLTVCVLTNPVVEVELGDIESVTVDSISVSDEATAELVSLINSYRCIPFRVGSDDPNSLSRAIQLNCTNGDFYVLHYQYYSGFSFNPRHAGEDDYRSILTFFTAEDGGQKAWKMEYDFDAELKEWLSEYSSPSFGAFSINQPYGVVEVTYESPLTSFSMVAQQNTPEYLLDEDYHLFSIKEYSEAPNWTDLGEISEITITKESFDDLFRTNSGDGWWTRESASAIRRNTAKAWSVIYNQEKLYYILQQKNGELYLAYGYYDYSEKDDPVSDDTYIRWLYKLAPQSSENVLCVKIEDHVAGATQEPRYNIFDLQPFDGEGVTLPGVYTAKFLIDEVKEGVTHVIFDTPLYQDGYETHGLQMKAGESLTLRTSLFDEYTAYTFSIIGMNDAEALISLRRDASEISDISDPTDDPNFAYDTAVEKIFEDERNEYFISGLYSQHIIVQYTDGTQENIVTALNAGRATFADLDKFGIRYWAEPKADPLEAVISSAILDHYASKQPDAPNYLLD